MNPEAQRIAIAEACGWIREYADVPTWDASLNSYKGGYEPVRTMLFRRKEKCFRAENLPDYTNDLNAMHEAEKTMTPRKKEAYATALSDALSDSASTEAHTVWSDTIHATAAQRAEAFLRTLGKWEGDK